MNRYGNSVPRAVFSFAAVAMTGLVLSVAVVVPAKVGSSQETPHVASSQPAMLTPTNVALSPSRIEVFGAREQKTAYQPRQVQRLKQQS